MAKGGWSFSRFALFSVVRGGAYSAIWQQLRQNSAHL